MTLCIALGISAGPVPLAFASTIIPCIVAMIWCARRPGSTSRSSWPVSAASWQCRATRRSHCSKTEATCWPAAASMVASSTARLPSGQPTMRPKKRVKRALDIANRVRGCPDLVDRASPAALEPLEQIPQRCRMVVDHSDYEIALRGERVVGPPLLHLCRGADLGHAHRLVAARQVNSRAAARMIRSRDGAGFVSMRETLRGKTGRSVKL